MSRPSSVGTSGTYRGYTRLDTTYQEIRLLRIQTRTRNLATQGDDIVECSLEEAFLADANPFYALSYAWGPQWPTCPLLVGGQTLLVRQNLSNFLRVLRDSFCSKEERTIRVWADSVCIDQQNFTERNEQVSMMGDIYSAADAVYAWLGLPPDPADEEMQMVSRIAAMRTVDKNFFQRSNNFQFEKAKLRNISSSTYWNRLWIKQEVLLGKNLWIYYGAAHANWKDLLFAANLGQSRVRTTSLSRIRQSITRRDSEDVPPDNYEAMLSLLKERTFMSNQIDDLPGLVRKFHTAECVEGRDKIYALLSLVDSETRRKINVDYAKPFFEVLMENYTYWTGEDLSFVQLPTKETSTPIYQYQTLYHQLSKILSRQEVDKLYDEQYNRRDICVDGSFTTFALSEVRHVERIATIGSSMVEPYSDLKGGESDIEACVLRVSIQSQSKWSSQARSYIVYTTKPPGEGDLVARIGFCDFFCRDGGNGPELFAYGVEMKSSPKHRLKDMILRHPCVWLSQRFPNVSFTVVQEEVRHSSATQTYKTDSKLMILCNSSAMLTLLFESFEDGLTRSEPVIDNAGWSPYDFGIEHGLLASCLACSNFDSRHTPFEPECCCQWLDRSFNVSAIARTKSHDATV